MTPQVARMLAAALNAAANKASAEGRDVTERDIDLFAAADDKARAELQAMIEKHRV